MVISTDDQIHTKSSSRHYRIQAHDKRIEWLSVLLYHMLVVAGVALTAAGSVKLQKREQPLDKAMKLTKAGIAILAVAWGILVGWTGLSFISPRGRNSSLTRAGHAVSILHPLRELEITNVSLIAAFGCRFCPRLHWYSGLL